jgi:hypothetical protein
MEGNIQVTGDLNQAVSQVSENLERLIVAAGGKIEQAWPYLIKETLIEGWLSVFSFLIFLVFMIFVLRSYKKYDNSDIYNRETYQTAYFTQLIVSVFGVIISFI